MTTPHDAHTLNACLARVIGVDVVWNDYDEDDEYWQLWDEKQGLLGSVWNPLHDAHQMDEVEAWLIDKGVYPSYSLEYTDFLWRVHLSIPGKIIHQNTKVYTARDPDKKRALALAIWEMEQSQKETT